MTKVLITGATGNIGSQLVKLLQPRPDVDVVPCFRSADAAAEFERRGLAPRYLNMDDVGSVRSAMAGIDRLFLLKPYSIKMLIQSKRVLDAAKHAGVAHVVNLGAHGVDETPWAIIGWHHMVERYTEALGFDFTHLRPNFFMDNLLRSVSPESGEIYHYLGDAPISWVSTADIAACAAAALCAPEQHRNRTYSLAFDSLSMPGIAGLLEEVKQAPFRYVRLPREVGLENMLKIGREKEFIEPWLDYMEGISSGQVTGVDATFQDTPLLDNRAPQSLRNFVEHHWKPHF